jgi:hypothetical protein
VRREKREARKPRNRLSDLDKDRLLPGFVRYEGANGTVVYDSYIYQPVKGHERDVYPASSSATLTGQSTRALSGMLPSTGKDSDSESQGSEHEYEHSHDREVERPREIFEPV